MTVFNGTLGVNGQNEPHFPRDVGGKGAVGRMRDSHFPHVPNKISTDNARAGSSARAREILADLAPGGQRGKI